MPDTSLKPARRRVESASLDNVSITPPKKAAFVELGLLSCFTFLRGASDAVDLVGTAHALGYDSIGIADVNSFAGVVRVHSESKTLKIRPVIGTRIETIEGLHFLAYPVDRAAYGRLCNLISTGRTRTLNGGWQAKGKCEISLEMLMNDSEGVQLILIPPTNLEKDFTVPAWLGNIVSFNGRSNLSNYISVKFDRLVSLLVEALPSFKHIAASYLYCGDDVARIERLNGMAQTNDLSLLATNDVHYATPDRRPLQDVMTAIKHKTTIAEAGKLLAANGERYLKSPQEMQRLFARWPDAISASCEVAASCAFSLDELRYEYPKDTYPKGFSPHEYLEKLTWDGSSRRYPQGLPNRVRVTLERELELIKKLNLARYFLTIKDIVDYARSVEPPILCQGRGSAANSAVCYCLEITSVDPAKHQLLFDRFISEDRKEPPDIDVDFEHERREEVIQYIYRKYGRHRSGLAATVIHYRPRMAIREVGKAMGLSEDVTSALSRTVWGSYGSQISEKHIKETGMETKDPHLKRVIKLAEQMIGMPRHLSQHVGGFVLTDGELSKTVPIGNGAMPNRSFIEWDKDDIEELGILKIDVLALGMLTCIRKSFELLEYYHSHTVTLATVPREDPETYTMLQRGDSLGVFQVESRAQMNMLPRLKPKEFYDLVIQVAIVRPGPIQGDMVHPYLKRRRGLESVEIPAPSSRHGPPDELSSILERTLGVPIFQEQAMKIALDAAKFSSIEANRLRKAMATFRSRKMVYELESMMVGRMINRGYDPDFSERCFNQIKGFGEYGFPESHAASFAHLVYVSSWLKCHFPAAFACALLNSQPMGFYAPAQIIRDAKEHGVEVLPADINYSDWDNTLTQISSRNNRGDGEFGLRIGLRQIDGLPEHITAKIISARLIGGAFSNISDLHTRSGVSAAYIERLASADCFSSLGLSRREALWQARALISSQQLPLFFSASVSDVGAEKRDVELPTTPLSEEVITDYQTTRFSLKAHPVAFLRSTLGDRGFLRISDLRECKFRSMVQVSGLVLIRQRPGSAKGVCFVTLEDETGVANIVIWPNLIETHRKVIMGARLLEVRGRVEYDDEVIHIIAEHMSDASENLYNLADDLLMPPIARADNVSRPLQHRKVFRAEPRDLHSERPLNLRGHPREWRILPKSRDFH